MVVHRVLREAVQACVDCAKDERAVYDLLQEGNGKIVVTGACAGSMDHCRYRFVRRVY